MHNGTIRLARAVVEGMKKVMAKLTRIRMSSVRFGVPPKCMIIHSAKRRARLDLTIAAVRTKAETISQITSKPRVRKAVCSFTVPVRIKATMAIIDVRWIGIVCATHKVKAPQKTASAFCPAGAIPSGVGIK